MPHHRHFTTRRGFIAGLGFGAVSLYGAWAAHGAAPLPFRRHDDAAADHAPPAAAGGHAGGGGGGAGRGGAGDGSPSAAAFRREHDTFLRRHEQADGSVDPHATADSYGHDHGHGTAAPAADAPVDVLLLAESFGYSPAVLRLRAGVAYRFRMMADDVTHGASLQLGPASRIIRLRPGAVSEQTLTFTRPGEYLVYCTVYCGEGHDLMHGRLIVT
ncbi:hypothetical protein [Caenispirillum bisanense]|uniref:hypothetical protein n=1 Tax=Caenispirillum bisanense TaxID=414052 RepID=UPI0031D9E40A